MNTSTNAVNFPADIDALRAAVRIAIEFYQGSPATNKNKLNEAVAAGLKFDNYDQLSAALKSAAVEAEHVPVTFVYLYVDENRVKVGDDDISPAVFDHELVDYVVREREDAIEHIVDMVSEARPGDRALMRQDINYLESLNDRFVFSSVSTNEFIAASDNPVRFNEICAEICAAHKNLSAKLATDQLFNLIISDEAIQQSIEDAAESSPRLAWGVMDIAETVKSDLNIDLDTDDTALFGLLLKHFNAEQKRLIAKFNEEYS
jgi:hypothetical protein